jgi:hypothetical protein
MFKAKRLIIIFSAFIFFQGKAQVSSTGCYISGALINPGSTAGCGNSGNNNYCNLASLYVPAFTPTACGTSTSSGGVSHVKSTVYTLPAGCTATIDAEFKKRNYLGVGATGTGCSNCGMDGSPDGLYITQSGGTTIAESSTIVVNVGTCGAYPSLGTYTTAVATISPGCNNADGTIQMILTGGTFTIGGASNRADEIITFTVNMSGTCGPACSGVLPIELISFYGEPANRKINLEWKIATEQHVNYYLVERSLDGLTWEYLSKTIATNKVYATNLTYKSTDNYPLKGINYYRLTNVDMDDERGVSAIIAVEYMDDSNMFWVEQTDEEVIIHQKNDENRGFELIDSSGKRIWETKENNNLTKIQIPKKDLGKGMFILKGHSGDKLSHSKVIIY